MFGPFGYTQPESKKAAEPARVDASAIMIEQLAFLVEHARDAQGCGHCSTCRRYDAARAVLLGVFEDTKGGKSS